ncbi:hypothetical protein D3C86_480890 [compost metagenome]
MVDFRSDPLGERAHGFAQGVDPDDIPGHQRESLVTLDNCSCTHHALDGQRFVLFLHIGNALPIRRTVVRHLMGAHDNAGVRHSNRVFFLGDAQLQFQLPCRRLEVHPQQLRGNAADEDNQTDGAEQVGNRVGNCHMAIEFGFGGGVDRQLIDRTGGGAHDRRVGQRPGAKAGGEAGVKVEDRIHQQDRAQRRRAQHHRQQHQFQSAAIKAAEKLRATLEADRVDEHHKKH